MSTGSIVGGVVGAVIGGALTGWVNPAGYYYGFMIGFGVGAMVDPMQADMPHQGPQIGNLMIPGSDEGPPIFDVLGTTKIGTGNIIWYCCERVVEIKEEVGKGGSEEVVKGYEYHFSWALGLCMGPVDTLFTVLKGDDVVWSGVLNCPASGGQETIVLSGMGSMTFYFGTTDQVANALIGANIADPTLNPPYRRLCYVVFNDCSVGSYENIPTMKFILKKAPEFAFNANNVIDYWDYNPAHAKYYIFNTLLDLPASYLHESDFSAEADTLFNDNRGISILFSQQQAALSYIEGILAHVDGIIRYGADGKFHPKLLRGTEAVASLPFFDKNIMLEKPTVNRRSWFDTLNEVRVQYSKRWSRECEEDVYVAPVWDEDNPDTVAPGGSISLNVLDGVLPFTWKITGDGYEWDSGATEETIESRNNILKASGIAGCAPATITVTDVCGFSVSGTVTCDYVAPACDAGNPETIAPDGSAIIVITDGAGSFTWSVSGTGFSLDESETTGKSNTLRASAGAYGSATITITDICGNSVICYVRCTVGGWVLKGQAAAVASGETGECYTYCSCTDEGFVETIGGNKKWGVSSYRGCKCKCSSDQITWHTSSGSPIEPPCGSPVPCNASSVSSGCPSPDSPICHATSYVYSEWE